MVITYAFVFNGAGHHEILYRLEYQNHHCRVSSTCLITTAYKLATEWNEKTVLMFTEKRVCDSIFAQGLYLIEYNS